MKTKKQIKKEQRKEQYKSLFAIVENLPKTPANKLKEAGRIANDIVNFDLSDRWSIPSEIYTKIAHIRRHKERGTVNACGYREIADQHFELFEQITNDGALEYLEEFKNKDREILRAHVHLLEVWLQLDKYLRHNCMSVFVNAGDYLERLGYLQEDGYAYILTDKGKALLHLYPSI